MRKTRWIAPVFGMLALAALGRTALAQAPAAPPPGPARPARPPARPPGPVGGARPRPPAPRSVAPPPKAYPGHPTYTPVAPDAASPAGWPPKMQPWPTISPFQNAFQQTYNDDGIWFREVLNHKRTYQVNVDYISADFRDASDVPIGHTTQFARQTNKFGETGGIDGLLELYGVKDTMVFIGRGRYFEEQDGEIDYPNPPGAQIGPLPRTPNFQITDLGSATLTDDLTFTAPRGGLLQVVNFGEVDPINDDIEDSDAVGDDEIADTVLYAADGGVLGDHSAPLFGGRPKVVGQDKQNPASPGIRMSFGLTEEDDTGLLWTGYWINGKPAIFKRGWGDPGRPVATNIVLFAAPHLGTGGSFVGNPDNTGVAVQWLDYNTLFKVTNEIESAGTDLAFFTMPLLENDWFRLRPMFGVRYDYVGETFTFLGRDNGVSYVYDSDGDAFENQDDITGDRVPFSSVVASNIIPLDYDPEVSLRFPPIQPYETTVVSEVQSHLYGPQIGFDMQAGGEHLMLSVLTKTGVVVNTERLTLDAAGFGVNEALTGTRIAEHDTKTHTRLVPFVEFDFNANINIFPIIPIVNKWDFLKNARIRAGWTALVFGGLQRPIDQVVWRAQHSGGPYIKERNRQAFYMQYWNVGLHWKF